jgi:hypothetical protein
VRDFTHIEAESRKQNLCIGNESARTQLGPGVMSLFEYKRACCQFWSELAQVKGCGDAGRATADDNDVMMHENVLLKIKSDVKRFEKYRLLQS